MTAAFERYQRQKGTVYDICKDCGAPSLRRDEAFFRKILFFSSNAIFQMYAGDGAFVVATCGKTHMRIYGLAVRSSLQRRGIGKRIMRDLIANAVSRRLKKITLRANIKEGADEWYAHNFGFVRVSRKGDDYEMHKDIQG